MRTDDSFATEPDAASAGTGPSSDPPEHMPCGHGISSRCGFSSDAWLHCDACGRSWVREGDEWVPQTGTIQRNHTRGAR